MLADRRPVLVGTVVIGGNRARAQIGSLAHVGIAQVGEVIGFSAFAEPCLFGFNEVADVRILAPIPGKAAVGVEVPNQKSTPVGLREIIERYPETQAAEEARKVSQ